MPIWRGLPARTALLALLISSVTALLVFLSLYFVLVRPMARITRAMVSFRRESGRRQPHRRGFGAPDEIGIGERELAAMQRELYGSLQQRGTAGGARNWRSRKSSTICATSCPARSSPPTGLRPAKTPW